ncbi:MAG: hypothetical protein U0796_23900 [Gemmatales bacterium]
MNHDVAQQIDWLCEQYLQALEHAQFSILSQLWDLAAHNEELELAFHELNEALLDEECEKEYAMLARLRPT